MDNLDLYSIEVDNTILEILDTDNPKIRVDLTHIDYGQLGSFRSQLLEGLIRINKVVITSNLVLLEDERFWLLELK